MAFFAELGMELEGNGQVEGLWADRTVGLDGVRSQIAMMQTPACAPTAPNSSARWHGTRTLLPGFAWLAPKGIKRDSGWPKKFLTAA